MIRGTLTILSFLSAAIFPWPLTAILALAAAAFEPLVPLALGIFADTLYYSPKVSILPIFTLAGALVTALAFILRKRIVVG